MPNGEVASSPRGSGVGLTTALIGSAAAVAAGAALGTYVLAPAGLDNVAWIDYISAENKGSAYEVSDLLTKAGIKNKVIWTGGANVGFGVLSRPDSLIAIVLVKESDMASGQVNATMLSYARSKNLPSPTPPSPVTSLSTRTGLPFPTTPGWP